MVSGHKHLMQTKKTSQQQIYELLSRKHKMESGYFENCENKTLSAFVLTIQVIQHLLLHNELLLNRYYGVHTGKLTMKVEAKINTVLLFV